MFLELYYPEASMGAKKYKMSRKLLVLPGCILEELRKSMEPYLKDDDALSMSHCGEL